MNDWDRKPKEPISTYLKLKNKDQEVTIRIAASPYREVQIWPSQQGGKRIEQEVIDQFTPGQWMSIMRDTTWSISEAYHLFVIDRADSLPKILQISGPVYGLIREYAQDPKWGNPAGYDITIKRTEKPGSYWKITPDPNKSDLLISESNAVKTIQEKLPAGAIPAAGPQPDDVDQSVPPEPLPWETSVYQSTTNPGSTISAVNSTDDVVITDIGDKPINLDDIPF